MPNYYTDTAFTDRFRAVNVGNLSSESSASRVVDFCGFSSYFPAGTCFDWKGKKLKILTKNTAREFVGLQE